jgi:DNA N-6-adenine-methyltransferase (Dam)
VATNLSFGIRQAQKYMRLADHAGALPNANSGSHLSINDALACLRPSHTLEVMGSSESGEWYTPPPIFELAVATLGEVDLDPCWHPVSPVRARTKYTAQDNGLAQGWAGRVYLNPPYGRAIEQWVGKPDAEYDTGAVSEAIALVPARVGTAWFRRRDRFPRCFVYGRLTFVNAQNSAPFPSAIPYLGKNVGRFVEAFATVGSIFVRLERASP